MENISIDLVDWIKFIRYLCFTKFASPSEKKEIMNSRLKKYLPVYLDRLAECLSYYPMTFSEFVSISKKYNFPNTDKYKEFFTGTFGPITQEALLNSYRRQDKLYVLRLMLAYHRFSFIDRYTAYIGEYFKNYDRTPSVLDYGCGVADVGLYFAQMGFKVTLVDLDTPRAQFACGRFKRRGLNCDLITLNSTEVLPDIEDKFDLIIATEILEHFRYPTKMISFFYEHLQDGGLLFNSMGRTFERDRIGDHLSESLDEGNSIEYKSNFQKKFEPLSVGSDLDWLFKRRAVVSYTSSVLDGSQRCLLNDRGIMPHHSVEAGQRREHIPRRLSIGLSPCMIFHERCQQRGQAGNVSGAIIVRIDALAELLRDAVDRSRDDGQPECHGLERHARIALYPGRQDEGIGSKVVRSDMLRRRRNLQERPPIIRECVPQ